MNKAQNENLNLAGIVERNIQALLERRIKEQTLKSTSTKVADKITQFTGSMIFVYLHMLIFGIWIGINLGLIPLPKFDPQLIILAMAASVEAIFLSTFVLISQNRLAEDADKRADLDLQVSLLAEHEITRIILLVKQIAEKLGIEESKNPELDELTQDIRPEVVLDTMEKNQKKIDGE